MWDVKVKTKILLNVNDVCIAEENFASQGFII